MDATWFLTTLFILLVSSCCTLSSTTSESSTSSTTAPTTTAPTTTPTTSPTPSPTTSSTTTTQPTTTTAPTPTPTTTATTAAITTTPTTTITTTITTTTTPSTTSPTTSPTTPKTTPPLTTIAQTALSQDSDLKAENNTLKIVVGILAAVIGLEIIIAGIYCILRKRRRRPPFIGGDEEEPALRHEMRPYFRPASSYDLGNSPTRTVSTTSCESEPMTAKSNKGNTQMFTFSNGNDANPKDKPLKEINENEEM